MNTQELIGKILKTEESRDAVHIAIIPIIADEELTPGQHIGIKFDKQYISSYGNDVGIVDPFLLRDVRIGERFWLFLYPNTITSLKHDWSHPNFPESTKVINNVLESEQWLKAFATEWGMEYETMLNDAQFEGGLVARNVDIHSWGEIEDGGAAFWYHLEIVTGRKFDKIFRNSTYFSCSC